MDWPWFHGRDKQRSQQFGYVSADFLEFTAPPPDGQYVIWRDQDNDVFISVIWQRLVYHYQLALSDTGDILIDGIAVRAQADRNPPFVLHQSHSCTLRG